MYPRLCGSLPRHMVLARQLAPYLHNIFLVCTNPDLQMRGVRLGIACLLHHVPFPVLHDPAC